MNKISCHTVKIRSALNLISERNRCLRDKRSTESALCLVTLVMSSTPDGERVLHELSTDKPVLMLYSDNTVYAQRLAVRTVNNVILKITNNK